ncbi:triacylglycerol lipase [Staphylococcus massiliensis]|uniref:esterase/lipase family protein n=1 Tax=Staphylococcus massiliensis TaxID=555791 RepID=UPI001EDD80F8|nr:triacylglycerol lipase [Staphylococcus massiliensis]MCG3412405.1 triacylglycerol lipase [Staphylococcus massiliensis]
MYKKRKRVSQTLAISLSSLIAVSSFATMNMNYAQAETTSSFNQRTIETSDQTRDALGLQDADHQHNTQGTEFKNQYPIVFVHGYNSFVGENIPSGYPDNYWGGKRVNVQENLTQKGYDVHQASVGAYSSNHERAAELYYYLKGGTVDYGAAHSKKHGHKRFGKTYEGVLKDWKPGQKVHFVGHSMGGQTMRLLEATLRNGSQEEIEYHKKHGGEMSPLYEGGHNDMVASMQTLVAPHNGSPASDVANNSDFITRILYDRAKNQNTTQNGADFGLEHFGLEQREGESYIEYSNRVKDSAIWTSKDTALYDLTREGAAKINQQTPINPNVYYRSFAGEASHEGPLGKHRPDMSMLDSYILSSNIIGETEDKAWRVNDGIVSTISEHYPEGQPHEQAQFTDAPKPGVWQATPTKHDWDHTDFVGRDYKDKNRTSEELETFYTNLAKYTVKVEQDMQSK